MYAIEYSEGAEDDLKDLRAYDRTRILDRIEGELTRSPAETTRNKKPLPGLVPPWEHTPPVWQLRVGDHRVFYDVDGSAQLVMVRAIRCKPPHATTEDIL
jgi:mRNA-degrading endonuclease RelE of RelBE toxin-antitoxin system